MFDMDAGISPLNMFPPRSRILRLEKDPMSFGISLERILLERSRTSRREIDPLAKGPVRLLLLRLRCLSEEQEKMLLGISPENWLDDRSTVSMNPSWKIDSGSLPDMFLLGIWMAETWDELPHEIPCQLQKLEEELLLQLERNLWGSWMEVLKDNRSSNSWPWSAGELRNRIIHMRRRLERPPPAIFLHEIKFKREVISCVLLLASWIHLGRASQWKG